MSLRVKRVDDFVLFPIMSADVGDADHEIVEDDFEERKAAVADYSRLVDVPESLRELLPTSFDIIGDVAIMKLPDELLTYSKEIGAGLCRAFPRLRTVALDKGVKG